MNRSNAKNIQSETQSKVVNDTMLDEISGEDIDVHQTASSLPAGAMLRDARVAKKLSLQDISKYLRISVKQIEALEDENFATLPEPVIVRGFIRNYARMLGVNAEPMLDAYKLQSPEVVQAFTMQSNINMPINSKDKQSWMKYIVASVFVVIGLGVWLFYIDLKGVSTNLGLVASSLAPQTTVVTTPVAEPLPEIALPVAERAALAEQPVQMPQTEYTVSSAAGVNDNTKSKVAVASATSTAISTSGAPAAVPISTDEVQTSTIPATKLNFSVKQETWLNVSDADGKVIYNKILAAGTQESLQVQAALPIKVIVGNVNGTTFIFNGNPIDLASYAKLNVAKFSLK